MSQKMVLAYDLGGTKVAVGIVDSRGKIREETRVPVNYDAGKSAVIRQLIDIGRSLLSKHPRAKKIGIASAGPLDPIKGILLEPTNYTNDQGGWGKVPITRLLSRALKRPAFLENDAAAAILAEHWIGAARKSGNALVITLGTGVGVGSITNGELTRAGHLLHPEASHIIIGADDTQAPCGCGNYGCLEAYLSGRNFSERMRKRWNEPDLHAEEIAERARAGEPRAIQAFQEYSRLMAISLHNFAVLYAPDTVVFTGSFAACADLFLKDTHRQLKTLLVRKRVGVDLLPQLKISTLSNRAGLIGGAYVALHR